MVAGLAAAIGSGIEADAADTYKNWTYATAGAPDGMASADTDFVWEIDEDHNEELGGTKFSGYVNFNGLAEGFVVNSFDPSRLAFGWTKEAGSWDRNKMIWFGASKLGAEEGYGYLHCGVYGAGEWAVRDYAIPSGEEIFLQVAFDYIDSDDDGDEDDLQLHIWINGAPATQVVEAWGEWNTVTGDDICIPNHKDDANIVYVSVLFGVKTSMQGTVSFRSVHPVTFSDIKTKGTYFKDVELCLATEGKDGKYEKDLESITINGEDVTFEDGKYTIPAGSGKTTIVVTDKKGDTVTYDLNVMELNIWYIIGAACVLVIAAAVVGSVVVKKSKMKKKVNNSNQS